MVVEVVKVGKRLLAVLADVAVQVLILSDLEKTTIINVVKILAGLEKVRWSISIAFQRTHYILKGLNLVRQETVCIPLL